jgi:protein-tyrosine phosphatase/predicted NAD-dependent protein-ADP-ribosyltransferase YbiA (DUF1768 family)
MNFCSQFEKCGFFGPYPTKENIEELETNDFSIIVNLTMDGEDVVPYVTNKELWKYPIKDNSIPTDWKAFSSLIYKLRQVLNDGHKVYIHCRGGHGRSSMLVACLMAEKFNLSPEEAVEMVTQIHNSRKNLNVYWLTHDAMSLIQKMFVYKMRAPICFVKTYTIGNQAGFSIHTYHPIQVDGHEFSTIEAAFQALRNMDDIEYVKSIQNVKNVAHLKFIGEGYPSTTEQWNPEQVMSRLIRIKYETYPDLKVSLISTGIRPIIDCTRFSHKNNLVGTCLMQYRREIYLN